MSDDEDFIVDSVKSNTVKNGIKTAISTPPFKSKATSGKALEKIYQKKTQLEHVLLRPDTYIGSVQPTTQPMWVWDRADGLIFREITFVPGLFKIFDEILVNAADNKIRDSTMNCIKINIDRDKNSISIWNNGKGIPVVEHKTEKIFIPELIFGHLLTSSNFNDDEKKVTGGRNGYGAKLCNIFSSSFTVETACREYGKKFKQTWTNNMSSTVKAKISEHSGTDFTCITFEPDLAKFHMTQLDDDIIDLFSKRAYDIAASTGGGVKIYLNNRRLPIDNFKDYIHLYTSGQVDDQGEPLKVVYERVGSRWEIAVCTSDKGFQSVSFVNSISTTKGGTHVEYVTDQIVTKLLDIVKKKNKAGLKIKPYQIKNHLWVFVNCLIENPSFDSQTKENMTLPVKSFGSQCTIPEKFLNTFTKCGIIENIMTWIHFKAQNQLNTKCVSKKLSKIKGIPKLNDANLAGTKDSLDCTLILTEGDSAKTFAVSGISVIGPDKFGIFPLRGKLLNVREATHKQLVDNIEINHIIRIIGLQYKKQYNTLEDLKTLRYGRIMIMTDQDQDGSHIKGLIINFIHYHWPSLIKQPFMDEFITPLVKVSKKKEPDRDFFSLPEFEEWKRNTADWNSWSIKYFKGLGTSTAIQAKQYFANMNQHRIRFKYSGAQDDDSILLAFSRKRIEDRKEWLKRWMEERKERRLQNLPELFLYGKSASHLTYSDFINKELVLFSNMDNERSIPSICDGLKPGQRKVLFTCFKRNDKREVKVAQLAGSVSELSAYHHGEASLMGTIINLAQNYVGSNNLNILRPNGQFGSRLRGGKDAASPRYIFTMLSPITRALFSPLDDPVLNYLTDDNLRVEPEWYCPIIPMILVNGAEGIGTGWSTKIPNYDTREVVRNIIHMIHMDQERTKKDGESENNEALPTPFHMIPRYKYYKGEILEIEPERCMSFGEIKVLSSNQTTNAAYTDLQDEIEDICGSDPKAVVELEITELPIHKWTDDYKTFLDDLLTGENSSNANTTNSTKSGTSTTQNQSQASQPSILDYKDYCTEDSIRFLVKMSRQKYLEARKEGLHKFFKLQTPISLNSMVLFDANGVLKRYSRVESIIQEFYQTRLAYYQKRKLYMQGLLTAEATKLDMQARFILEKIRGDIKLENVKRVDIIKTLISRGYLPDPVKKWKHSVDSDSPEENEEPNNTEDGENEASKSTQDFEYLLGMPLWSLTKERVEDLIQKQKAKNAELAHLKSQTIHMLWLKDLEHFIQELDKWEAHETEEGNKTALTSKSSGSKSLSSKNKKTDKHFLPSTHGMRIKPEIDSGTLIKIEKSKRDALSNPNSANGGPTKGLSRKKQAIYDAFAGVNTTPKTQEIVQKSSLAAATNEGDKSSSINSDDIQMLDEMMENSVPIDKGHGDNFNTNNKNTKNGEINTKKVTNKKAVIGDGAPTKRGRKKAIGGPEILSSTNASTNGKKSSSTIEAFLVPKTKATSSKVASTVNVHKRTHKVESSDSEEDINFDDPLSAHDSDDDFESRPKIAKTSSKTKEKTMDNKSKKSKTTMSNNLHPIIASVIKEDSPPPLRARLARTCVGTKTYHDSGEETISDTNNAHPDKNNSDAESDNEIPVSPNKRAKIRKQISDDDDDESYHGESDVASDYIAESFEQ